MWVRAHVYVGAHRIQRRASDFLNLGVKRAVNHLIQELRMELTPSARATGTFGG